EHVTPTPAATKKSTAKPASAPVTGGGATPDAPEKKGLLPGFEGAIAIAGLLSIAYVMMRRK
ncbi:MAG: PGF-CTERM sorting domain-containing protein, partial [Methanosarcinales archaeon]|nr:PGF-CTERM sorting domain-containing protein [Methanosarcinales archaeon]